MEAIRGVLRVELWIASGVITVSLSGVLPVAMLSYEGGGLFNKDRS